MVDGGGMLKAGLAAARIDVQAFKRVVMNHQLSVWSHNLVGQLRDLAALYMEALHADLQASKLPLDQ